MEVKAGYRQTEVGVIPEDWEVKPLFKLATEIGDGIHATPQYVIMSDFFFVNGNNLIEGKIEISKNAMCVNEKEYRRLRKILSDQTILISINGTIGNLAFFNGENIVLGKSAAYINLSENINKYYIFYSMSSAVTTKYFENELTGTTIKNLSLGSLRNIPIPFPKTYEEQRAIATALSDVDALIISLDKLIAKKRDIKQAAMQELLTGKRRLPGFGNGKESNRKELGQLPDDWIIRTLKTVSTMNGRIGWQGLKQDEFTSNEDDPFLITGMNFKDGEIRWEEVYHIPDKRYEEAKPIQLQDHDILMTKDGTIGKLLYVENIPAPGKASLNSHLLVFRPLHEAYVPKFLFYQLNSKRFADYIDLNKSGTTFFGITQQAVGNYPAYLPRIEEQTAIATVLSDMDADLAALEQKRDKTKAIKQGMMQELLTGRIRLV